MTFDQACQQQIDDIMDTFEFNKVREIMYRLDWTWGEEKKYPSDSEIRIDVRGKLKRLVEMIRESENGLTNFISSGGFRVQGVKDECEEEGTWVKIELFFGLEHSWDGVCYEA